MKKIIFVLLLVVNVNALKADEGMWFPQLLQQLNINDMQMRGLKIGRAHV